MHLEFLPSHRPYDARTGERSRASGHRLRCVDLTPLCCAHFQEIVDPFDMFGFFGDALGLFLCFDGIHFPRSVTTLSFTSTLIFRAGVAASPINLAVTFVCIHASSTESPILSPASRALSRVVRAISSVYSALDISLRFRSQARCYSADLRYSSREPIRRDAVRKALV